MLTKGQNYIKYHIKANEAHALMQNKEYKKAIEIFECLEKKYDWFYTERFAKGMAQIATGDYDNGKAAVMSVADSGYGAVSFWLTQDTTYFVEGGHYDKFWDFYEEYQGRLEVGGDARRAKYKDVISYIYYTDSLYQNARKTFRDSIQVYHDSSSVAYQNYLKHIDWAKEQQSVFMDSMVQSGFVIGHSLYGSDLFIETILIHMPAKDLRRYRKTVLKWVKQGLVYPYTYASVYDWDQIHQEKPMYYNTIGNHPYGTDPDWLKNRAKIGIGNNALRKRKFHYLY